MVTLVKLLWLTGFEDAFSVFDANGNGKIKVREVFPLIRSLGHNPIEAAVWCYLNELDLAGQLEQFIYGRPFPCDLWVWVGIGVGGGLFFLPLP